MLDDVRAAHTLVILAVLAVEVLALVQVWRDCRRSAVVKVVWTVVIGLLPVIGVIGRTVDRLLGRAADRLNRSGDPTV